MERLFVKVWTKILKNNQEVIQKRLGAAVTLVKIADLDIKTDRGIDVEEGVLTTSVEEVIDNPDVDNVVE